MTSPLIEIFLYLFLLNTHLLTVKPLVLGFTFICSEKQKKRKKIINLNKFYFPKT